MDMKKLANKAKKHIFAYLLIKCNQKGTPPANCVNVNIFPKLLQANT